MKIQQRITKILSTILMAALCITPEMASAAQQNAQPQSQPQQQQQINQQAQPANPQPDTQDKPDTQEQQPAEQNRGTRVNPSEPPLQPVTTYPDAPTPQQDQRQSVSQPATTTTTTPAPAQQTAKPSQEPVGAAAAQSVPTAGGAASRPAGAAIAPAKQHQTRSLLIKIGAIAAGGLAAGTIYALSKGTSPKPPGAGAAGTTQK